MILNVKVEELEDEIKKYNLLFGKLVKRKNVKVMMKGYVRKLEIIYNK